MGKRSITFLIRKAIEMSFGEYLKEETLEYERKSKGAIVVAI